jgi:heme-degrading monooxygenase HmoA
MHKLIETLALVARAVARVAGFVLRRMVGALVAAIIIFEEWGWRPLSAALARLARYAPIAALERMIQSLPPYGALAVFAVPSLLFFPLKLVAMVLVAQGHLISAGLLFAGAKVAGTALIARLFILTEAQLMRIPWFAYLYGVVMPWKNALTEWARQTWAWRMGRVVRVAMVRQLEILRARLAPRIAAIRQSIRWLLSRLVETRAPLALPAPTAAASQPARSGPIAVIFEVEPAAGARESYLAMAAALRPELEKIDGFVSVERFQSLTDPAKMLSLSIWRDEAALAAWRNLAEHRHARVAGRSGMFAGYRLRVAAIVRDYGLKDRDEAPGDSREAHRATR